MLHILHIWTELGSPSVLYRAPYMYSRFVGLVLYKRVACVGLPLRVVVQQYHRRIQICLCLRFCCCFRSLLSWWCCVWWSSSVSLRSTLLVLRLLVLSRCFALFLFCVQVPFRGSLARSTARSICFEIRIMMTFRGYRNWIAFDQCYSLFFVLVLRIGSSCVSPRHFVPCYCGRLLPGLFGWVG